MKPLLGFGKHIRTNMDPATGLVSRVFQTGMTNAPQPLGLPCAISTLQCGAAPLLSRWLACRPHRGAGQETASLEGAKGTDFFPEASCGLSICFQFVGASPRSQFFSPAIAVLSCGSGSTQFAEFLLIRYHRNPPPPSPTGDLSIIWTTPPPQKTGFQTHRALLPSSEMLAPAEQYPLL